MCFKCGRSENNLFVPKQKNKKDHSKKRQRNENERLVPKASLASLPDDVFVLIFLYAGIRSPGNLSRCSFHFNNSFQKSDNEAFWGNLSSKTSVVYQSSVIHRACFPVGFTLCDDDICQLLPSIETPSTWKEYYATACLKLLWLYTIEDNCATLRNIYAPSRGQHPENGTFSVNDVVFIRSYPATSPYFKSICSYDNIEMLRLRAQKRQVHTTSSGCIVEKLTYTGHGHYLSSEDVDSEEETCLCVFSAITGDVLWRDVKESLVDKQFLGLPSSEISEVEIGSVFRREMPFEVYFIGII